jgi:hypothetical protein
MQALNQHIGKDGFRLRGTATSRIDGFSDVVFGFALTLLVVSLEVPHTYDELHKILLGFYPFAICFALFITVWYAHLQFFRRFGLHDVATIVINCALLFTVLAYVYPLKFLFSLVVAGSVGHPAQAVFSNDTQVRELIIVYGAGFAAIYIFLSALYWNAWRQRHLLCLSPLENTLTLTYLLYTAGLCCIGLLCCAIAAIVPPVYAGDACYVFLFALIWRSVHKLLTGRSIRKARARTPANELAGLPLTS